MKIDQIHHVAYCCRDARETVLGRLDAVKWDMLEEWSRTRRAPRHTDSLHQRAFSSP